MTARFAQLSMRVGTVGAIFGVLLSCASIVRLLTLPPDRHADAPVGFIVIGFGVVFALLARAVSRAFARSTIEAFVANHAGDISPVVRQEFESLNLLPGDHFFAPIAEQSADRLAIEPLHPVDSMTRPDGVVEAVFRERVRDARVLFGDAVCQRADDASESWHVEFGVRRNDPSEMTFHTLDDIVQASPYLRIRFNSDNGVREPDEWTRGEDRTVASQSAEIGIGFYLHNPFEVVELLWVAETTTSLGRLSIRPAAADD